MEATTAVDRGQLERRIAELEEAQQVATAVNAIIRGLNLAADDDELVKVLAEPVIGLGAKAAMLFYYDLSTATKDGCEYADVAAIWSERPVRLPGKGTRMRVVDFAFQSLMRGHLAEAQCVSDFEHDERMNPSTLELARRDGLRSGAIVPLVHGGRWIGSVLFLWGEARRFSSFEKKIYASLIELAGPALQNRRLLGELRDSERRRAQFVAMIENSLDFVAMTDLEGHITYANPAAASLVGRQPSELLGLHMTDLHTPEAASQMGGMSMGHLTQDKSISLETELLHRDGHQIPVSMVATLIRNERGEAIAMGAVMRDLTSARAAEAERTQMQQEVIRAQQQAIQELSTPIIPIVEGIIVMPLVGTVNTLRARDILRSLLQGVREHRAKVVILDVTGVSMIDTSVAHHLNKAIQAARLKGAQPIVTGLSDAAAETIVEMGIDWLSVETLSDLQTGLGRALQTIGLRLER